MDVNKVTRVEIISQRGRESGYFDLKGVELQLQDSNRTLKIFINKTVK